jgi:hypothetical protein
MGIITITAGAYDPGDNAAGPTVEADLQTIVDEFNGGVETANLADNAVTTDKLATGAVTNPKLGSAAVREANVDYSQDNSGALLWRCGVDYVGADGGRIARVNKSYTWTGSPEQVVVTFATDCEDGDPAFTAAPTLLGAPVVKGAAAVDALITCYISAITTTTATLECTYGGSVAAINIQFGVAGPI